MKSRNKYNVILTLQSWQFDFFLKDWLPFDKYFNMGHAC